VTQPTLQAIRLTLAPAKMLALEDSRQRGDYDMDGVVIYQGSGSDILSITSTVFGHPLNSSFQLTLPAEEQLP